MLSLLNNKGTKVHGYFRNLAVYSAVSEQDFAKQQPISIRIRYEVVRPVFMDALQQAGVPVREHYCIKDRAQSRGGWVEFKDLLVVVIADENLRNFLGGLAKNKERAL